MKRRTPKWIDYVFDRAHKYWNHEVPCHHVSCCASLDKEQNVWLLSMAPVYQQVLGGSKDGQERWVPFIFDAGKFSQDERITIQQYAVASIGKRYSHPMMLLKGTFKGKTQDKKFFLRVFLHPERKTKAVEMVDTINKKVRRIERDEKEQD